ncbi:MAG: tRNA 2-selenouridine(34) synthase MnmH [Bacteroides sp.]|nr:tRNA 2-selenouridine(34) synthase MnmH [Bacteroides sp.]
MEAMVQDSIRTDDYVWVDVRTPSEYRRGHVPGAYNLPLFTDEERAEVGTLYARQGKYAAIERGLELTGVRFADMLRQGKALSKKGRLMLYCWRGGMRSASVAWLLRLQDIDVQVYPGGYRAYRNAFETILRRDWRFFVLGGPTLCGKTEILHRLAQQGEQVLDLEGMAHHKGSAFGALGQDPQPGNEEFSNLLHAAMERFSPDRPVWCEDESLNLGKVVLPHTFYTLLTSSPLVWVERPMDERVARGMEEYGGMPAPQLTDCLSRLQRRMGGDRVRQAIAAVEGGHIEQAVEMALAYYDKTYLFSMQKRPGKTVHRCTATGTTDVVCRELVDFSHTFIQKK